MDIATIQKRKFLQNLNKLYLSNGKKPSFEEIRSIYNRYFTVNNLGRPISTPYDLLEVFDVIDPFILNELMANSILNLEVLFDCIYQNNAEIMEVTTILNKKLERLKTKRLKLEDRIDEILFENSNSDGFYYSFSENFSDLSKVDLNLTSAYLDNINRRAEIPFITTEYSSLISRNRYVPDLITYSIRKNGAAIVDNREIRGSDLGNMFDGLNDTFWQQEVKTRQQGVVSLLMEIPLNNSLLQVSRIDAKMLMSSPSSVYVRCVPSNSSEEEQLYTKKSDKDYDSFSFSFKAGYYNKIIISIVKTEPDAIDRSSSDPYVYRFGIRELGIGAKYYDTSAELISSPISVSTGDNNYLQISTVAIDAKASVPDGTVIQYYVAADNKDIDESIASISSFNWIPIDLLSSNVNENRKYVSLASDNRKVKTIGSSGSDILIEPLSSNSSITTNVNPLTIPYTSKTAYKVGIINFEESINAPYILYGLNTFRHYGEVTGTSATQVYKYKDTKYWSDTIRDYPSTLISDRIKDQIITISTPIANPSSGVFKTKIYCDQATSVIHTLLKQDYNYNLSVYLNGSLIADLPSGTSTSSITWDFIQGLNTLDIYYDKPSTSTASFTLMSGASIGDYGSVFLERYSYVDPIEFRRRASNDGFIFTVDNLFGQRLILSNRYIDSESVLVYLSDSSDVVRSVRYRASMRRFNNALQTPSLESVKVRFRI